MNKLTILEQLQDQACNESIRLLTNKKMPMRLRGLFYAPGDIPPIIALSRYIQSPKETNCVLAEELGHYYTSAGNLLAETTDNVVIAKQEERARRWAVRRLITLKDLVNAFEQGIRSRYELAEYLEVTESFLDYSISYYKKIYGLMTTVDDKYTIYFEPLGIYKNLE